MPLRLCEKEGSGKCERNFKHVEVKQKRVCNY
jgi:hypothetical protein